MTDPLVESKQAEAANAAAVAEEARLQAFAVTIERNISKKISETIGELMSPERGRYVDVSRVKLICQSIIGIESRLNKIDRKLEEAVQNRQDFQEKLTEKLDDKYITKERHQPIEWLVYGLVALILSTVVVALLALVIISR